MKNAAKVRRSAARTVAVVAAAFGIALTGSTSASAHYVYQEDMVWSNNDSSRCVYNYSETSHGGGSGYIKGLTDASLAYDGIPVPPEDCQLPWSRPIGYMREAIQLYIWVEDEWLLCQQSQEWAKNSERADQLILAGRIGENGMPPCGPGYYGIINYSGVYYTNLTGWVGGTMWSTDHYLPASSSLASRAAVEAPKWADSNGQIEELPERVKVADANGNVMIGEDGKPVTAKVGTDVWADSDEPRSSAATSVENRRIFRNEDGGVTETVEIDLVRPAP